MISNMISDFQSTTPGWRKLTHKISHLLPFTYRTLTLILEVPQIHSWVQNSIIDRFWSTFACRSKPQRRQVLGEDPKNQMQVKAVLIFYMFDDFVKRLSVIPWSLCLFWRTWDIFLWAQNTPKLLATSRCSFARNLTTKTCGSTAKKKDPGIRVPCPPKKGNHFKRGGK